MDDVINGVRTLPSAHKESFTLKGLGKLSNTFNDYITENRKKFKKPVPPYFQLRKEDKSIEIWFEKPWLDKFKNLGKSTTLPKKDREEFYRACDKMVASLDKKVSCFQAG